MGDWISILILLGVSSFFSWSETGVISCSLAKIHRLSSDGDRRAKKIEKLLKHKEKLIGTILICNNAVNILSSAIATGALIKSFGEVGIIFATVIMTVLILVFGEIIPKTHAVKNAEQVALIAAPILWVFFKILDPITDITHKITVGFIRLFGIGKKKAELVSDLDELRGAIELKHKEGSVIKYDRDMLGGILDLGEVEVGEVVIHRKNIESINIEQNVSEIIDQALKIKHSHIPLWKGDRDNIVAILDAKKIFKVLYKKKNIENIELKEITSEPWFVPSTNSLRNQLFAFRHKKSKFAVVVDEYGVLIGIVTLADILEEIVGDINDDHRKDLPKITRARNGFYKIPGETTIRDVNRKLNWELPEDSEVSTIAGLVVAKIERIPEVDEEFQLDNFIFKILQKENNQIVLLKVKQFS